MRNAFTMLELVFVIVILGIVAGISSEVIATTYQGYINQRALYRSSIKTELAATQIANRLAYAIPGSIVARDEANLIDVSNITAAHTAYPTLQWIGYDVDGFTTRNVASQLPGWSGFADLNVAATTRIDPNKISLSTPGSRLALADAIIANLSGGGVGAKGLTDSILYFNINDIMIHNGVDSYNAADSEGIYTINRIPAGSIDTIELDAPATANIAEQYKLAWTSYAIVVTDFNGDGLDDLVLRYDFQPWNGETYDGDSPKETLLLSNVSVFRFTGSGNSVRFKICKPERINANENISVCKEKVVIR